MAFLIFRNTRNVFNLSKRSTNIKKQKNKKYGLSEIGPE